MSDCVASMYGEDLHVLGLQNICRCLGWVVNNEGFKAKVAESRGADEPQAAVFRGSLSRSAVRKAGRFRQAYCCGDLDLLIGPWAALFVVPESAGVGWRCMQPTHRSKRSTGLLEGTH